MPFGFRLRGTLDVSALSRALAATFPRQPAERVVLEPFDLARTPIERALQELSANPSRANGELPWLRAALASVSATEHVLLLVADAEAVAGRTLRLLMSEIAQHHGGPSADTRDTRTPARARADDLAWWTARLAGPLPALQLAADHPRPAAFSFRGAELEWRCEERLARALEQLARRRSASPSSALLAAFAVLLSRHSGDDEVVIGTSAPEGGSSRNPADGAALDTLVLRCDLGAKPAFADWVASVHAAHTELLGRRDTSFAQIVAALGLPRDASRTPVFSAWFGFEDFGSRAVGDGHLTLEPLPLPGTRARTDLSLLLTRTGDGFSGRFEYSTDLFEAATLQRLADGFSALLEAAVAQPDTGLDRLPVLSPAERRRQLSAVDSTLAYDAARTVAHRVEEQARQRPDAPALYFHDRVTSYGELAGHAASIAGRLAELGAGPGTRVAIDLDRGPHLVAALLATLRVGACYVPLDPRHPVERNRRILERAAPQVVLAETSLAGALPPIAGSTVLTLDAALQHGWPRDESPVQATADGLAYVIFTSGSTGEPKGVEITHAALVNFLTSMALHPGLRADDHLLAITTISFDIAGLELWLPLICGASVEIADRSVAGDPALLMKRMQARKPTVLQATPASFQLLIDAGWTGDPGLTLLCGGEALPPPLAAALCSRSRRLFNMYGPTETTIWSSLDEVDPHEPLITIGRPIHNTRLYVLDEHGQPVPQGVPGELCIGGDGVARGYHQRPDLTAERFLPDPFVREASAPETDARDAGAPHSGAQSGAAADPPRLYRTGDVARRLPDGRLQHLGRSDFQIKLRGYRIELGEIEAALLAHPEIERAVVHVWEPEPGDRRLVGYVVTRDRSASVPDDLGAHIKARLPIYMQPSAFVALAALPLTANGKVDRRALPAPSPAATPRAARRERTGPRDDPEVKITAVWETLLGVREADIADDFFASGGNSLLAVKLIQELNRSFGLQLPVAPFFENPTIGALADQVRAGGGVLEASILPLVRGQGPLPLYFICGIYIYQALAQRLGGDQASYGIFIPEEQRLFEAVEPGSGAGPTAQELAAAYVEALTAHQPTGPCALAGVSFGGVIAYETARQLAERGREVSALIIIDSILPSAATRSPTRWLAHQWRHVREHGLSGVLNKSLSRITRRSARDARSQPQTSDNNRELAVLFARRQKIYEQAAAGFETRPSRYDGRTIVIRASESMLFGYRVAPDLGWRRRVTSELRIYEVPGNHLGVLAEPDVSVTAEILRRELSAVQPAARTPVRR